MKICFINPAEQHRPEVYELARRLVDKDYEITIIQPCRDRTPIKSTDFDVIPLPSLFLPGIEYTIPPFLKEYSILTKLVKDNYDLIQTCDYEYLTSVAPIFVKKKMDIPLILTGDAFVGLSWFSGNPFIDLVARIYTEVLGKFIIKSYDEFVVIGSNLYDEALDLGIPQKKVSVIPNGIDLKKFNPDIDGTHIRDELKIKNDETLILFVGRMAIVKRIELILKLTKILVNRGHRIKTVLVGDGPYRKKYEDMAKPLKDNIIFTGAVPLDQIPGYIAASDIFILPSESEGLPTVLLEVAACGKPAVATNVGAAFDIVKHEKTGFLPQKDDFDSFVNYVELLINDEKLASEMGRNAHKHIKENFDWDEVVKKYEVLYNRHVK